MELLIFPVIAIILTEAFIERLRQWGEFIGLVLPIMVLILILKFLINLDENSVKPAREVVRNLIISIVSGVLFGYIASLISDSEPIIILTAGTFAWFGKELVKKVESAIVKKTDKQLKDLVDEDKDE